MSVVRTTANGPAGWYWTLLPALLLFVVMMAIMEAAIWPRTGGLLIYPLDDTYIQMAIAKNLARDGTWGVSHQFANAGSSLAWPAMLAVTYLAFGVNDVAPLVLNLVAVILLLVIASRVMAEHLPAWLVAVSLAGVVLALPLYHLARIGMEHTLACVVAVWVVSMVARTTQSGQAPSWLLLGAGALLTAVRFDLAAMVVPLAVALALYAGWRAAVVFTGGAAVPVLATAAYSWLHGWPLLPTPTLAKHRLSGAAPTLEGVLSAVGGGMALLLKTPTLLVIVLVCLVLLMSRRQNDGGSRQAAVMQAIAVSAILLHVHFGLTGSMFRYEGHLIAVGLVAIALDLPRAARWVGVSARLPALVLTAVLASAFAVRTGQAFVEFFQESSARRYEFVLTEFFAHNPWTGGVVLGDVGVIGYRTDLPIVDYMGLLTPELLGPGRDRDPSIVDRLARARGVKVSLVPAAGWTCVGEWVVDLQPEYLYAADAETAKRLGAELTEFSEINDMPLTLGVRGCGTRGSAP